MTLSRRASIIVCLTVATVVLSSSSGAHATTIVPNTFSDELNADGDCSLREAIQAANINAAVDGCPAGSSADVIELAAGTYVLTITGDEEDLNATGDLDVRSDVTLQGMGVSPTTIDAVGLGDRVLDAQPPNGVPPLGPASSIAVTLRNLRFANGTLTAIESGGGARIDGTLTRHVALLAEDCLFEGNSGAVTGGGLAVQTEGMATIRRSVFRNNTAHTDAGGLYIFAPTLVEDSTFDDNDLDAAIAFDAGGGGIMVNRPATIRRSTVSNNDAGGAGGGGIACQNTTYTLENSTVTGNTSTGLGGGGVIQGLNGSNPCTVTIDSSTITDNTGNKGGGYFRDTGTATIRNTIIAGNATTGTGPDVQGAFASAGHNLIGDGTASTGFVHPDDLVGTGGSPIDPLLEALDENGGPTATHRLAAGSPARDTGTCSLGEDQRGETRPEGAACDRGSVEAAASLCGPAPATGCHVAAALASSLQIKDNAEPAKDQLQWKWTKGAATAVGEFADPVNGSASYRVCLYDASANPQPLQDAELLPGGICGNQPCWKTIGQPAAPKGFKYKNKPGAPNGLTSVQLQAGTAGKAKLQVQGKGTNLALPTLGLTLPVTVQLIIDDGVSSACWQTEFATAQKNTPALFKAKGP